MIHSYAVDQRYVGEISGKISHTPRGDSGLTISVTAPFIGEILITCDTDIRYAYWNLISLMKPQSEHIEEEYKCYYHTEEEAFYISKYQVGKGVVPEEINPQFIIEYTKNYQRLQSHFQSLNKLHKGQSCSFQGYAIDRNKRPMHPSTVESSFNKHEWFYNPFSFEVVPLDENTIDDFVEETPISKEMTDKMVRYHQEQQQRLQREREAEEKRIEEEERRKEEEERRKNPGKWEKLEQRLAKYPNIITIGGAFLGATVINQILLIFKGLKYIYRLIFPN